MNYTLNTFQGVIGSISTGFQSILQLAQSAMMLQQEVATTGMIENQNSIISNLLMSSTPPSSSSSQPTSIAIDNDSTSIRNLDLTEGNTILSDTTIPQTDMSILDKNTVKISHLYEKSKKYIHTIQYLQYQYVPPFPNNFKQFIYICKKILESIDKKDKSGNNDNKKYTGWVVGRSRFLWIPTSIMIYYMLRTILVPSSNKKKVSKTYFNISTNKSLVSKKDLRTAWLTASNIVEKDIRYGKMNNDVLYKHQQNIDDTSFVGYLIEIVPFILLGWGIIRLIIASIKKQQALAEQQRLAMQVAIRTRSGQIQQQQSQQQHQQQQQQQQSQQQQKDHQQQQQPSPYDQQQGQLQQQSQPQNTSLQTYNPIHQNPLQQQYAMHQQQQYTLQQPPYVQPQPMPQYYMQ